MINQEKKSKETFLCDTHTHMHGRSDVKAVVLGLKNLRLTTSLPIVSLLSTTTSRVMLLLVKMIYIYCRSQKDLERFREGR